MATVYKTFLNNDMASTRTLLHEAIPLTGSLVSGTYGTFPNGGNIKNYAHGMFQSVYDYPYLSSSANHIYDLTVGYSTGSAQSGTSGKTMQDKKINMYTQMAQVLAGYTPEGKIRRFDEDGNFDDTSPRKLNECVFFNFARLLQKDEIKKGSFSMTLGTGDYNNPMTTTLVLGDSGKENDYRVNSPAGEYAILSASAGYNDTYITPAPAVGLIFYQAGIVVLSGSAFVSGGFDAANEDTGILTASVAMDSLGSPFNFVLTGTAISGTCDDLRHRIKDISFNNTTELNSSIYFCRINHNDYNYSSNPTYLSQSQIVVKSESTDAPVSYITTVGLYSADNELLAVAKLSEPLKKDPTNEMLLRVRLDY